MTTCKECGQEFPNDHSLHKHLKAHKFYLPDYYCKHYPRYDKLSGEQIQFKHKDEYFATYFTCRENLDAWLKNSPKEVKSPIILDMLERRIKNKELKFAPSELELFFADLPSIDEYKECFGSYSAATNVADVKPLYSGKWSNKWANDFSGKKIFIDTREQQPLEFKNQETLKLDVGDYAVGGEDFCHTFVDRKSLQDWAATLLNDNFDRFKRELDRCKSLNSFLWVVVETDLAEIYSENEKLHHKHNLGFVSHRMRELQHEYRGTVQFYFSGGRKQSQEVIPKLLCLGDELWFSDAQYWIPKQKGELDF